MVYDNNKDEAVRRVLNIMINQISKSVYSEYFVLKGGAVLMSRVLEKSRVDLYRMTQDIDIHTDNPYVWEHFLGNILNVLNSNNSGVVYKVIKIRSIDRVKKGLAERDELLSCDSIQLSASTPWYSEDIKVKIDMNVKPAVQIGFEHSRLLNMNVFDSTTMLVDKLSAISSQKIFRRIKDVYDICVLAQIYDFSIDNVYKRLLLKTRKEYLDKSWLTQENIKELEHAYEAYKGIKNKPNFYNLYAYVKGFSLPIYERKHGLVWMSSAQKWVVV